RYIKNLYFKWLCEREPDVWYTNYVISLLAYDGSNNYLDEVGRSSETGTFDDWRTVSKKIAPGTSDALPAGTKTVYVKVGTSNASGSGTSWFDGIQFEEGATATSFVCGSQFTINPSGTQSARYDGDGRKHLYTMNSSQNITKYQQDPAGLNLTESYTWDTTIPNTMTSYTNPEGKIWKYKYEPEKGNLITITDPQNKTQSFSWDSKSNLTSYIGKKGENYNYSYEGIDNLTSRDPNYTSQAKEYDNLKNLKKETNALGLAANEIKNSSFENDIDTDDHLPEFFDPNAGQQNTWSVDSSQKVFGNKSLKVTASSGNTDFYTVIHSDGIIRNQNADYVLSGYLKNVTTSGQQSTVLSVLACDSSWNVIGEVGRMTLTTSSDWQRWSTVLKPADFPSGTNGIRVKLGASNSTGSGTSYFDAIQLQENPVDTAYNLVDNSSFERGDYFPYYWNKSTVGITRWSTGYSGAGVSIENATLFDGVRYKYYFPYDRNKDYAFTAFAKTENLSAKVAHIKIEFYDANKNFINGLTSEMLQGNTEWHRLSVQLSKNQAPTNTVYIRPVLMTGNATGKVSFDNVRFQEGRITTDYGYESTNTWVNKVTDPLGYITSYVIEPKSGNVLTKTAPNGDVTEYTYDSMDRVLTTKPPGNDLLVSYHYDANGNSDTVTLKKPGTTEEYGHTTYVYNGLDLMESVINPLNGTTTYAYTPSGLLQQINTP
ncbi:MAG TPA: hypothetical protein DDY49_04040, partial [Paenibacillaceae bacterium]|nr:hypothetical protein [Paenibacillaceae bacterium]